MATLLLRLAAPLQSWGNGSKFNIRTTEREPTKSGVIGMISAALGIQRSDDPKLLEPLIRLRFGVRVDREGKLLKDFHMVHEYKNGKMSASHLTTRYYLSDAAFLVGLESDDKEYLNEIAKAISNPVYPLFLGRRSCPPTLPIFVEISDNSLIESLKNAEPVANSDSSHSRVIYDDDHGSVVQDVPVSFSQMHRQYGYRYKNEESILFSEHDAMAEL